MINLINLIMSVLYINHIFACLFVFVGRIQNDMDLKTWMSERDILEKDWKV